MRRIRRFVLLGIFVAAGAAFGVNFAPEPLRISAPPMVNLEFGDHSTKIPVQLSGGSATVVLSIFTKDQAARIQNARNGHLGWHYVDRIDTCIYVSPPHQFPSGKNIIEWNGRDENDYPFLWRNYTYYLCAFSDSTPAQKAFRFPWSPRFDRSSLMLHNAQGQPLASPVFFSAAQFSDTAEPTWNTRARWSLGGDPEDASLLETTRYRSWPDRGVTAPDTKNSRFFYTNAAENGKLISRRWEWLPDGDAILQMVWGEDGISVFPPGIGAVSDKSSGLVYDGVNLYSAGILEKDGEQQPTLFFLDAEDGAPLAHIKLSSSAITEAPSLAWRNGILLASLPEAALFQMINPYIILEDLTMRPGWENGPGDGFGDSLSLPGSPRGASLDSYGFTLFAEESPSGQAGLLTPDGTGAGRFPLPGMEVGRVTGLHVIDTGTAYDGLYFSHSTTGDSTGVWYSGYAVFKGLLRFGAELWNPYIRLVGPYRGQILHTGQDYTIVWDGYGYSTVGIELSTDAGVSWTVIKDGISSGENLVGGFTWRVADIRSSRCRLRVITGKESGLTSTSPEFTITGPVSVYDESTPRPFITVSNHPNPFNPATTIRYELGLPGRVTLTVYNALGQTVREMDLGRKGKGEHEYRFDASGLTSGVYFYRVEMERAAAMGKMLLVR